MFNVSGEFPEHLAGVGLSVMFELSGLDEKGELEFALEGADVFVFVDRLDSRSTKRDYLDDFSASQRDRIDLSGMDADLKQSGNQDFTYLGTQTFSGEAGELRWVRTASETSVEADLNGDAVADFAIQVGKSIDLNLSDFLL